MRTKEAKNQNNSGLSMVEKKNPWGREKAVIFTETEILAHEERRKRGKQRGEGTEHQLEEAKKKGWAGEKKKKNILGFCDWRTILGKEL